MTTGDKDCNYSFFHNIAFIIYYHPTKKIGRRSGLMVSPPVSISSGIGLGLNPAQGHCVVFLGKTLYSHGADFSTKGYKCVPVN